MGDHDLLGSVIVDRLEGVSARDDFSMTYDWQAWYGLDYDKVLVRAEGEIDGGAFKNARNELLWAHALTAFWDTHLSIRGTTAVWVRNAPGAHSVFRVMHRTGFISKRRGMSARKAARLSVLKPNTTCCLPRN
ncbi:MAG: copper resistance protein B [Gammaproteobacteria bacterium]|nr:copper resistance protein B [Gammaproteobacteria bacterium]